jgi:hypothetical protein
MSCRMKEKVSHKNPNFIPHSSTTPLRSVMILVYGITDGLVYVLHFASTRNVIPGTRNPIFIKLRRQNFIYCNGIRHLPCDHTVDHRDIGPSSLSHFNPLHTLRPYLFKIHLNCILPTTSQNGLFPSCSTAKNLVCISYLSHARYISSYLICF